MLLELFPFVILNNAMAFVYACIQCLDGPVNCYHSFQWNKPILYPHTVDTLNIMHESVWLNLHNVVFMTFVFWHNFLYWPLLCGGGGGGGGGLKSNSIWMLIDFWWHKWLFIVWSCKTIQGGLFMPHAHRQEFNSCIQTRNQKDFNTHFKAFYRAI